MTDKSTPGSAACQCPDPVQCPRCRASGVCLREVVVTCGTVSDEAWLNATHVLCLRQLPCDNPNHKPERLTHGTR